jgi:hypothetical protein
VTAYSVLDDVLDRFEYKPGYALWRSGDDLTIEWWGVDSRDGYGVDAPELRSFVATMPLVPSARAWRDPKTVARWRRHISYGGTEHE